MKQECALRCLISFVFVDQARVKEVAIDLMDENESSLPDCVTPDEHIIYGFFRNI